MTAPLFTEGMACWRQACQAVMAEVLNAILSTTAPEHFVSYPVFCQSAGYTLPKINRKVY